MLLLLRGKSKTPASETAKSFHFLKNFMKNSFRPICARDSCFWESSPSVNCLDNCKLGSTSRGSKESDRWRKSISKKKYPTFQQLKNWKDYQGSNLSEPLLMQLSSFRSKSDFAMEPTSKIASGWETWTISFQSRSFAYWQWNVTAICWPLFVGYWQNWVLLMTGSGRRKLWLTLRLLCNTLLGSGLLTHDDMYGLYLTIIYTLTIWLWCRLSSRRSLCSC